jgi:peptidoglycan-associated lipoprotein
MKSIVLSSVVAALLVFSGCSSKAPEVDESASTAQEIEAVKTETVASDSGVVSSQSDSSRMSSLEQQLSSIYFDFDKFNIRSDMQSTVSEDAAVAKTATEKFTVKLEGNCDEWGSDEYNFALGLKRADTVKKALVAEGVNAGSITMVSYGESNPSCSDKTKDCWAKNRRVDFKILP